MTQLEIRHAVPADAQAVAAIYNLGIEGREATFETEPRRSEDVARWLELGDRFPVIVADTGHGIAGWARISQYSEREAYRGVGEYQVYVHPAHRRRGVGRRLTRAACVEARQHGYWKLVGRLFTTNEASIALMRRLGFREVGVHLRHGVLDGQWRDVLVIELLLGDPARPT